MSDWKHELAKILDTYPLDTPARTKLLRSKGIYMEKNDLGGGRFNYVYRPASVYTSPDPDWYNYVSSPTPGVPDDIKKLAPSYKPPPPPGQDGRPDTRPPAPEPGLLRPDPVEAPSGDLTKQSVQFGKQQYEDFKKYVEPYIFEGIKDDRRFRQGDRKFFEEVYRPLENQILSRLGYSQPGAAGTLAPSGSATPGGKTTEYQQPVGLSSTPIPQTFEERARNKAINDVNNQFNVLYGAQNRRLQSYGLDPSKALSSNTMRRMQIGREASKSLNANAAYYNNQDLIRNMRNSVLGRAPGYMRAPISTKSPITPNNIGTMYAQGAYNAQQALNSQRALQMQNAIGYGKLAYGATNLWLNRNRTQTPAQPFGSSGVYYAHGGPVEGPGGPMTDSVPAMIDNAQPAAVSNGEYVVPKEVVDKVGRDFFDNLIRIYHQEEK